MRVLLVTSEAHPLAKSGGLADVSSALPAALRNLGIDARILLPGYPQAITRLKQPRLGKRLQPMLGISDAMLIAGELPHSGVPVWAVHSPSLFIRSGGLYQDKDGRDWHDNALRFAFLSHAAVEIGREGIEGWVPDVIHANDWHAGLVPLLLSMRPTPRPACVFTIHNLAFQGNFPLEAMPALGIPDQWLGADGIEFYGQASFLKAGIQYSDRITTVSPTYAREALTAAYGCGFDGILRRRSDAFSGILNGIDTEQWDPSCDPHLPQPYRVRDISGKRVCKAAVQREFGLAVDSDTPVIGYVSRLAHQKMTDVVIESLPAIADMGAQVAILGQGDRNYEAALKDAATSHSGVIGVRVGYDEPLAHLLQAGSDMLLAPARYEPCGLTQLYAMRYGTVPLVRRTGGLADTVIDVSPATISARTATGFTFDAIAPHGLLSAVTRALALYREPLAWRRLQQQGMSADFSWNTRALDYVELYRDVTGLAAFRSEDLPTRTKKRESIAAE